MSDSVGSGISQNEGTVGSATGVESSSSVQAPDTNQGQASTTGDNGKAQAGTPEAQAVQAPTFTPNFKVKSYDKEYEIDEMFRPLIKDADTEKKVKAVFEKAFGLDGMKPKYQKLQTDYDTYKKEADPILHGVNQLTQMLNNGDFDNFFKAVGIKKEDLYKYVHKQLSLGDMTPEQRAEYEASVALRQKNMLLEQQYQRSQEMFEQMAVQTRTFELNTVLSQPEFSAMKSAFEQEHGAGSFNQAVIEHGKNVWKATGRDLSAEECVKDFTKYFGRYLMPQQQQTPVAQPTTSAQGKPVIPNLGGRSASPVKAVPKSIADLKKLAAQAQG